MRRPVPITPRLNMPFPGGLPLVKVNPLHARRFTHQKNRFGLFIRTIRIKRAEAKLTLANLAYNMDRLIFHERRAAAG
jgi:hypothetical protein